MVDGRKAFNSEIVGDQRREPAVGDPLQQTPVAPIENGAAIVRKLLIDPAVVAQEKIGVPVCKQTRSPVSISTLSRSMTRMSEP
jgi:hypothetical protein